MNDKKRPIKRYLGRIEINIRDGRVVGAMVDALTNEGLEVIIYPREDKHGIFTGETMEIYQVG